MDFLRHLLLWALTITAAYAACPEIVGRAEWGARARSQTAMKVPVSHVFIHHTAGATCNSKDTCSKLARQTQAFHIDTNKWNDLGYNFLVGGDGRIYEGRGWKAVGAHTQNYNSKSIAISFMGNFEKAAPGAAMLNAARNLIDCGVDKFTAQDLRQSRQRKNSFVPENVPPERKCPNQDSPKNIPISHHAQRSELCNK